MTIKFQPLVKAENFNAIPSQQIAQICERMLLLIHTRREYYMTTTCPVLESVLACEKEDDRILTGKSSKRRAVIGLDVGLVLVFAVSCHSSENADDSSQQKRWQKDCETPLLHRRQSAGASFVRGTGWFNEIT